MIFVRQEFWDSPSNGVLGCSLSISCCWIALLPNAKDDIAIDLAIKLSGCGVSSAGRRN